MKHILPTPESLRTVRVHLLMLCQTCKVHHEEDVAPEMLLDKTRHWTQDKHPVHKGCEAMVIPASRFVPKGFDDRGYEEIGQAPAWLEKLGWRHNTDFKLTYRASAAVTNAIQSLATSSTWLAGYESDVVDNTTNKDLDIQLSGKTTVGTTPTISTRIEHHVVTMIDDSTWPDVFDGTTSAETVTSQGIKDNVCVPLVMLNVDATTSDRAYPYTKRSVAALFGGICPPKFVIFTTHNTGVNLNATGGNQVLTQAGVYITGT